MHIGTLNCICHPVYSAYIMRINMNCPNCGGIADNGHNREDPPAPYLCTKCEDTLPKITLTEDDWAFMLDCEYNQPIQPPTPAMLRAIERYKEILGIEER